MTARAGSFRRIGPLVVLLLLGLGGRAWGQAGEATSASIGIQDVPLGQALEQAAAAAGISLVYDAGLVRDRRASCIAQDAEPEGLLRCLLDDHPIDYVRTSKGTYVLRPAVRRPPQRGQLAGTVRGGAEGHPLINAHVRLPNAKDFAGTVTDSTGQFRLTGLLPGPHTLVVTHLGYNRHEATVYVPPNGTARHQATLAPAPIVADSLVIDAARYGAAASDAERVAAGALQWSSGATAPDVLDAAGSILGVAASPPYADLHIQGGPTGGHTMRLDGVPIHNPASTGRLLGAFSPLALEGLTARKAGFGALHGNALSGTLDLTHDLSGRGSRYGTVRLDSRSLDARLQGTTALGTTPVTAMVAGRVSVWDVYQDVALQELIDRWSTLDPVLAAAQTPVDTTFTGSLGGRAQPSAGFYDVHGAARFDFGPARELYVSGYHGGSHLGADLVLGQSPRYGLNQPNAPQETPQQPAVELPTHDEYAWTNTAAQMRCEAPVSSRTRGTLRAAVSHYRGVTQSEIGPLEVPPQAEYASTVALLSQNASGQEGANELTEVSLEGQFDHSIPDIGGLVWSGGLTYLASRFRIGNAFAPRLRHQAGTLRLTTAAEATVGLGEYTRVEGGLRLTAQPGQRRAYAEPRGALRYHRAVDGFGTIGLNVRGGLYRQFTTQFGLLRDGATAVVPTTRVWLPITRPLVPPRTAHLAANVTWRPDPSWTVDVEGYRKWQSHLLAVDYPALRQRPATTSGLGEPSSILDASRGTAYGGGLQVAYEGNALAGSARYAYSRARRTFPGRFGGRRTPVPWNEPHRLTLTAEVPLGRGLALDAKGEGVWGRRWAYRRAYYAYLTPADLGEAWERLQMDRPGSHALPPRYRLDLGLSVQHAWQGVDVKGRLGVANVLGRRNVADRGLQPQEDGTVTRWARTLPGRRATVSIRIRY